MMKKSSSEGPISKQCSGTFQTGAQKVCIDPQCNFNNPFVCQKCEERHQHKGQTVTVRTKKIVAIKASIEEVLDLGEIITKNSQEIWSIIKQATQETMLFCKNLQNKWRPVLENLKVMMSYESGKIDHKSQMPNVIRLWEMLKEFNQEENSKHCNDHQAKLSQYRKQEIFKIYNDKVEHSQLPNSIERATTNRSSNPQKSQVSAEGNVKQQAQLFLHGFFQIFKSLPIVSALPKQAINSVNLILLPQVYKLQEKALEPLQKFHVAKLLELLHDKERALEIYDQLLEQQPKNVDLLSKRAQLNKELRKYQLAINDLSIIINQMAKSKDIQVYYFDRGQLHEKLQNYSYAERDYRKCLANDRFGAVIKVVELLKLQKSYQEAEELLLQGLSKGTISDQSRIAVYNQLGQIATTLHRLQDAISYYTQALNLDPKNFNVLISRASLFHQLRRHQQSRGDYTEAIKLKSSNASLYYNRGVACLSLKKPNEAIQDFLKVVKFDPQFKLAYVSLANTYFEVGNKDQSLKYYLKAAKYFQDNPAIWYNIGKLNSLKNPPNTQEALINFNKALQFVPQYTEAFLGRIQIFMATQNYKEAEADLTKLIALNHKNHSTVHNRGVMRQKQGNFEGALEDFNQILEKDPNNIATMKARARVYHKTDKIEAYEIDHAKIKQLESNSNQN